jgi:predicted NAD/FAD-dependent oxidoreductase
MARKIVVVGAGIAGLTAARRLTGADGSADGSAEVVVLDKGRGVGGRVATRRIGEATLDHGAQFLTTHTPDFAETVAGWERAGVVRPWFHGRIGPQGVLEADGHVRYRGAPTMNAIARHLAIGLDVRLGTRVTAVQPDGERWIVRTDGPGARDLAADVLVLTTPVPQALDLLAAGGVDLAATDREALGAVRYDPCLALLAPLHGPSGLAHPGAVDPDAGPIEWMADNHTKGVSGTVAVTLHADAAYSHEHWTASVDVIAADLLAAAGLRSGAIHELVQVQRWRYARPTVLHAQRCLVADLTPALVLAGDAFGEAKIEGAALSGAAAAEAVAAL